MALRMVHISSCCCLVSPSWLSTGWTLLKSLGRLSKRLPVASSSLKLQRVPTERAAVRQWLRDAVQSFVITPVQRTALSDQSHNIIVDPTKDQRDYLGGWSAQGSDSYTGVAARMITHLQKLVIRTRQGASEDPFAETGTSKQFDDHLCSKGYSAEDRAQCFKGLERPIPQRPQQELEELRLEEGEPPREAAVEPEPERQEELRVDPSAKKDKRQ